METKKITISATWANFEQLLQLCGKFHCTHSRSFFWTGNGLKNGCHGNGHFCHKLNCARNLNFSENNLEVNQPQIERKKPTKVEPKILKNWETEKKIIKFGLSNLYQTNKQQILEIVKLKLLMIQFEGKGYLIVSIIQNWQCDSSFVSSWR